MINEVKVMHYHRDTHGDYNCTMVTTFENATIDSIPGWTLITGCRGKHYWFKTVDVHALEEYQINIDREPEWIPKQKMVWPVHGTLSPSGFV